MPRKKDGSCSWAGGCTIDDMTTTHYTRCPGCQTVFRVSAAQLSLRDGQVRCGHCRAVFDANRERVALDASRGEDVDEHDELAAGRPTVTLRSAEALQPVEPAAVEPTVSRSSGQGIEGAVPDAGAAVGETAAIQAAAAEAAATETAATETAATETAATETAATETAREAAEAPVRIDDIGLGAARFQWKPRKPLRERPRAVYVAAIAVLVVMLAAQALFEYRDALAAHAAFTRPILDAACAAFGCRVGPLRDAGALSIDASDLRADPAHRGLLKLSATIRNRASYPIAWPYLELTLTDASDRIVARRAFPPSDYAGDPSDVARGIAANGENVVGLSLDASQTSQSGYRLYLFYP